MLISSYHKLLLSKSMVVNVAETSGLPRDQFLPFHHRKQRLAIIVAHRRAGKTVATINDLIWWALCDNKADGRSNVAAKQLRSQTSCINLKFCSFLLTLYLLVDYTA